MSLWGFDGEDNTLTSWSSLTQFDDMIWNEFGDANEDHVVPDPDPDLHDDLNPDSTQFCKLSSRGYRKRLAPELCLSAPGHKGFTTSTVVDCFSDISRTELFSDEDISRTELFSDEDGSEEGLFLQDTGIPDSLAEVDWADLAIVPAESESFGSDVVPDSRKTDAHFEDEREEDVSFEDEREEDVHFEDEREEDVHLEDEKEEDVHFEDKREEDVHLEDEKEEDVHFEDEREDEIHFEDERVEDVNFEDEMGEDHYCEVKEEVQPYFCGEDASMGSLPFSVSNDGSKYRRLEFENECVPHKSDSLLELSWENIDNLDDMEKLFRNDSSLEPVAGVPDVADGLDWPSSSPPAVNVPEGQIKVDEKPSPMCELTAVKLEVINEKDTAASDFGECLPVVDKSCLNQVTLEGGSHRLLEVPVVAAVQQNSSSSSQKNRSRAAKSSDSVLAKSKAKEETTQSSGSLLEVEKANLAQAYRARRHTANRKRSQERFKRSTLYRKLSPGPPYNTDARQAQSLPLRFPVQPPHLQPSAGYPFHFYPPTLTPGLMCGPQQLQMAHGVPFIPLGYPIHPMAAMSACPQHLMNMHHHPQPMYVDLHQGRKQTVILPHPSPLVPSHHFDAPGCPSTSSPSMTKQEKLEKLRWRQRMQARIAVEHQEQLLASQNGEEIEARTYLKHQQPSDHDLLVNQPENPLTAEKLPTANGPSEHGMNSQSKADKMIPATKADLPTPDDRVIEDFSLESSVLGQLKCTVSALDANTRICIRDALYRLARSAMKRRASGGENWNDNEGPEEGDSDANALDSSTESGPLQHSGATSISVVETETNPIDRSIAKLLFSKPSPTVFSRPFGNF